MFKHHSGSTLTALKSLLLGGAAGLAGTLVGGVGGSFMMVPLLTSRRLIARLPAPQAHATSLVAVAATGISGTMVLAEDVDYEAAAIISVCGLLTASAGRITATRFSPVTLRKALGAFLFCVAPVLPFTHYCGPSDTVRKKLDEVATMNGALATTALASDESCIGRVLVPVGIGTCSGFLAGLFGVGSGAMVVPALSLLTDKNHREILGTSLCALVFPAITGTMAQFARGTVAMRVAPALAAGAFAGGVCGGTLVKTAKEKDLKNLFCGWTIFLGMFASFL